MYPVPTVPRTPHWCRQCHRHRSVTGYVSTRGLCPDCAVENYRANFLALTGHDERGHAEWFARWQAGCTAATRDTTAKDLTQ